MKFLSVTEVLSVFQDFSRISPEVLEAAAQRGSSVHRICAAIAKVGWYGGTIPEEQQGRIQSFTRWLHIAVEKVILVEQRLECSCYGYYGHPDLVVILYGDLGATVPDLKTPLVESPVWRGQVAAYRHLAECAGLGLPIIRQGALMLSPKGRTAKLKEYQANKEDFAAFLAGLTAVRYFKKG